MKKYGLRIGSIGVEFCDQTSREKALLIFTKGGCVKINTYAGIRYEDSEGAFSTYERETNEQMMNCDKCKGVFSSEVCTSRTVPERNYSGKFKGGDETENKVLCDACYAKIMQEWEVYKAEKVLENKGE